MQTQKPYCIRTYIFIVILYGFFPSLSHYERTWFSGTNPTLFSTFHIYTHTHTLNETVRQKHKVIFQGPRL